MTVKKTSKTIVRTVILILSVVIMVLTIKTLSIGLDLAMISEQNASAESWRQSGGTGIIAANNVYEHNMEIRESIYNSKDMYTRWISTSNNFVQLAVGFSLLALSALSFYIWYSFITMKIRRLRRKITRKKKS